MVKPKDIKQFIADVIELFGFLLAEKIGESPLTPKDTGHMRDTFPGTYQLVKKSDGYKIKFTTPFYTKFIHDGTRKLRARPFVNQILHQDGERLLKKAFQIINKRYK